MTTATWSIVVWAILIAALVPLAVLGHRQSRRARAVSDDEAQSNFLATVALVFAVLASPLGIVLAHVSLRQIAFSGASGARLATVSLWIAYGLTAVQLTLLLLVSLRT